MTFLASWVEKKSWHIPWYFFDSCSDFSPLMFLKYANSFLWKIVFYTKVMLIWIESNLGLVQFYLRYKKRLLKFDKFYQVLVSIQQSGFPVHPFNSKFQCKTEALFWTCNSKPFIAVKVAFSFPKIQAGKIFFIWKDRQTIHINGILILTTKNFQFLFLLCINLSTNIRNSSSFIWKKLHSFEKSRPL